MLVPLEIMQCRFSSLCNVWMDTWRWYLTVSQSHIIPPRQHGDDARPSNARGPSDDVLPPPHGYMALNVDYKFERAEWKWAAWIELNEREKNEDSISSFGYFSTKQDKFSIRPKPEGKNMMVSDGMKLNPYHSILLRSIQFQLIQTMEPNPFHYIALHSITFHQSKQTLSSNHNLPSHHF